MNYLKSSLQSMVGNRNEGDYSSSAETVERLVERLQTSTTFDDRRDALRALKSLSKRYRLDVGAQSSQILLDLLKNDPSGVDLTSLILETLNNIVSGDSEEDNDCSEAENHDLGERFTETLIKDRENVVLFLSLIESPDFNVRLPAVRLLTNLLRYKCRDLQEILLSTPGSIPKITDLLQEQREVLRNDAVLLLFELIRGNTNIQKTVAFQNAFDGLLDIIYQEGDSIVAEDCLYVVLHLLKNNSSNQHLFRENSHIQKLVAILSILTKSTNPNDEASEINDQTPVSWNAQRISNVLLFFQVVRSLVSPSNQLSVSSGCQKVVLQCGLLQDLCQIMMSGGIPADILTETINTVAESIRGCLPNQEYFETVMAPSEPLQPALIVLLLSMVSDKQPFNLRCSVLYCVECFLYKNEKAKQDIISTLLPSSVADNKTITAGHIICTGLVSTDPLVVWYSCCAFLHCLIDVPRTEKERLLNVQLAPSLGHTPVSLMQQIVTILSQSQEFLTRIGLLMFLNVWLAYCPNVVSHLLQQTSLVPFLITQAGSSEGEDSECLLQCLAAFTLGVCVHFNDDSFVKYSKRALKQIIEKRIGVEIFLDKVETLTKSEQYARASQRPQLRAKSPQDVAFDYEFCRFYRTLEQELSAAFKKNFRSVSSNLDPSNQFLSNGHSAVSAALDGTDVQTSQQHYEIIDQYKAIIKRQDEELSQLKQKLFQQSKNDHNSDINALRLQLDEKCSLLDSKEKEIQSIITIQSEVDGLKADVQRLQVDLQQKTSEVEYYKQQAQSWQSQLALEYTSRDPSCLTAQLEYQVRDLESQLSYGWQAYEQQAAQISTLTAENSLLKEENVEKSRNLYVLAEENKKIRSENEQLVHVIDAKNAEIANAQTSTNRHDDESKIELNNVRADYVKVLQDLDSVRKEHEDLLLLLADQDVKLKDFKRRLKSYGDAHLSPDEDEDLEDEGEYFAQNHTYENKPKVGLPA